MSREAITPVNECRVQQVIITKVCVGEGTEDNCFRIRTEVRTLDGELLAVYDPEIDCEITRTRRQPK